MVVRIYEFDLSQVCRVQAYALDLQFLYWFYATSISFQQVCSDPFTGGKIIYALTIKLALLL
jgi:hypothetical protein